MLPAEDTWSERQLIPTMPETGSSSIINLTLLREGGPWIHREAIRLGR